MYFIGGDSDTNTRRTEPRYRLNTQSQSSASWRDDGFMRGSWNQMAVENSSRVWISSLWRLSCQK